MNLPVISGAAFTKARYKIHEDFFKSLFRQIVQFYEQEFTPQLWNNFRLVAADGTTLALPNSKEINSHYGISGDRKMSLANVFTFYDALTGIILDTVITTESISEKTNLKQMLLNFNSSNDLLLLDAGFGYFNTCKYLYGMSKQFCIRLDSNFTGFAKSFKHHSNIDEIITWIPSNSERTSCKQQKLDTVPIQVRITKILDPKGKETLLVSSLIDQIKYTNDDIKDLYNYRWNAEEGFKKLKSKMKIEYFGCKKVQGIKQEFYIHCCMQNLVTIMVNEVQEKIENNFKNRKLKYRCNWQNAYRFIREKIAALLSKKINKVILKELINQIESSVIAIKKFRNFIRNPTKPKRRYFPCYK